MIAERFGIDKNGWNARVDESGVERTYIRHLQIIHHVTSWEHSTAVIRRIHKIHLHFGRRKSHAIEFKFTALLHCAIDYRHMHYNGFADVDLPHFHRHHTIVRNTLSRNQPSMDRKRPHRSGKVAAVSAPIDKRFIYRHLPEQIIHIVIFARTGTHNHRFAGARCRTAHAINLFTVRIWATNHS
ncbi:Uncharacterised protein [Vibrio cholerae]|nr:Uncharacterised protein [Vibrio cholerae]